MRPSRRTSLLLLVCALLGAHGAAAQTLRGSRGAVDRVYRQARDHDLTFYRTPSAVRSAAREGTLLRLNGSSAYRVHQVNYPYALPTTHTFVNRLAEQYLRACGEKMVVTSATRPQTYRLANSVDRSVHPAGMAVDIRKPKRARCAAWLRETLLALEGRGVIDATEEHNPPHFHVAVFPRPYLAYLGRTPRSEPALSRGERTSGQPKARIAAAPDGHTYRVRRGDTLWSIARRHRTSVETLKDANGIRSSRIVAGQVLVIPSR